MTEKIEEFKCPNCNSSNYIIWGESETERNIPCLTCYGEEFSQNESGDTVAITRGARFTCVKSSGFRGFCRDSDTFVECEG